MHPRLTLFAFALAFCALPGAMGVAQAPAAVPEQPPQTPNPRAAEDLLSKVVGVYQSARSYQGDWTYLQQTDGKAVRRMVIELRSKGPTRLQFHLRPAADKTDKESKGAPAEKDAVPELRVVLDGKYAWSENASDRVYYRVPLPKSMAGWPLMFFPQMAAAGGVERGPDEKVGDRNVAVVFAKTKTGGLSRVEVDTTNYRVVRIASDEITGFSRTISTIVMDKETFDAEIPDSTFVYKPPKGFKEIPAPSDAVALFGGSVAEPPAKPGKDK